MATVTKKGCFSAECDTCYSEFTYEYTETFEQTHTYYDGSTDTYRYVKCPVCELLVRHFPDYVVT